MDIKVLPVLAVVVLSSIGSASAQSRSEPEFLDSGSVSIKRPLLPQAQSTADGGVRTVEVTGFGESAEAARKDAARLAVQQVTGLFIDNRRRVELNITDRKVTEIVDEKILSYTNGYVSRFEPLASEVRDGQFTVKARVGVAVAPLLKILQDNALPVVPFDAISASATANTMSDERTAAVELYSDLLGRIDSLVSVGIGAPQVDPSFPAQLNMAWLRIPVTFKPNADVVQEWRTKFERIGQAHAKLSAKIESFRTGKTPNCVAPYVNVNNANGFLGNKAIFERRRPSGVAGAVMCFASPATGGVLPVECHAREFTIDSTVSCRKDGYCVSFRQATSRMGLAIEFLDDTNKILKTNFIFFHSYPELPYSDSHARPQGTWGQEFIDLCLEKQGMSIAALERTTASGDVFLFPPPGNSVRGYVNVQLPNADIARVASVRARIGRKP